MTDQSEAHIGAWLRPDERDLPDRIDDHLRNDTRTRSRFLVEAGEMLLAIETALAADPALSFDSPADKRSYVRQCILDDIRRHRDG